MLEFNCTINENTLTQFPIGTASNVQSCKVKKETHTHKFSPEDHVLWMGLLLLCWIANLKLQRQVWRYLYLPDNSEFSSSPEIISIKSSYHLSWKYSQTDNKRWHTWMMDIIYIYIYIKGTVIWVNGMKFSRILKNPWINVI